VSVEKKDATSKVDDTKVKFREALVKKRQGSAIQNNNIIKGGKILVTQSEGNSPKLFRRKSGSA
jgi:Family of unknown function (DUF5302)